MFYIGWVSGICVVWVLSVIVGFLPKSFMCTFVVNSFVMPDKKPVSVNGMRRYTRFGLPLDNPVSRDATAVRIPSISPQEREAAAYYNPPVKDVSSGSTPLDFLYNNQWLISAPVVGNMIKNAAHNYSSFSDGEPVVDTDGLVGQSIGRGSYQGTDEGAQRGMRKDMLGAYFGKETLPKSTYKPTSDYMEFLPSYSIKGGFEESDYSKGFGVTMASVLGYSDRRINENSEEYSGNSFDAGNKIVSEFIKNKKPVYMSVDESSELTGLLGADLGGHKVGLAWDPDVDLPYMSVSDAWDFEPQHYSKKWGDDVSSEDYGKAYVQSSLMHKAGKPFKVYDRFYFDPDTREYIPDSAVAERSKSK